MTLHFALRQKSETLAVMGWSLRSLRHLFPDSFNVLVFLRSRKHINEKMSDVVSLES